MKNLGLITKASAAALVLAAGLMTGCGSDGGGGGKKGQFVDSPVIGISYTTSSGKEGTTDANGKFSYKKGDTVTFFIGSIELPGGIPQDGIITPAHLAGTADWQNDDLAIDIIQFLLSIDEDGDPENGIQVPEGLAELVDDAYIDGLSEFGDAGFDADLQTFITSVQVDLSIDTLVYRDGAYAETHFSATIEALGITIEIQVSTEAGPCNGTNTADIQGTWSGSLSTITGDSNFLGPQTITVDGTSMTIGETSASTCTYSYSEVSGAVESLIDTWTWVDGTDTFTLVSTELVGLSTTTSFTATESSGTAVSSGTVTLAD